MNLPRADRVYNIGLYKITITDKKDGPCLTLKRKVVDSRIVGE